MNAAGQGGIPTAFIVGKDGKVAWIGHPMEIEKPLASVVAGTYDLATAAKKYAADARLKGVTAKLGKDVVKAKKDKDYATALKLIDEAVAKDAAIETKFGAEKYFLLVSAQRAADAATYGRRFVSQIIADNAMALNSFAWQIVDPQGPWKTGDYALAVQAAEGASKLMDDKDASTLDTLGLALFKAGQIDRAIEIQTKAVALAAGNKDLESDLKGRLDEFKNAKKSL